MITGKLFVNFVFVLAILICSVFLRLLQRPAPKGFDNLNAPEYFALVKKRSWILFFLSLAMLVLVSFCRNVTGESAPFYFAFFGLILEI